MEILLPFSRYYWLEFLPRVLWQLAKAFLGGGAFTLVKGFIRGMEMVLTGELAMWAAGMALLCGLLFVLARAAIRYSPMAGTPHRDAAHRPRGFFPKVHSRMAAPTVRVTERIPPCS